MSVKVACTCGKNLLAPDDMKGKRARCPGCKQLANVPIAVSARELIRILAEHHERADAHREDEEKSRPSGEFANVYDGFEDCFPRKSKDPRLQPPEIMVEMLLWAKGSAIACNAMALLRDAGMEQFAQPYLIDTLRGATGASDEARGGAAEFLPYTARPFGPGSIDLACSTLIEVLKGVIPASDTVRARAATGLGTYVNYHYWRSGPAQVATVQEPARTALTAAQTDPSQPVRFAAAVALTYTTHSQPALPGVIEGVKYPGTRRTALQLLARIDYQNPDAFSALMELVCDPKAPDRDLAIGAWRGLHQPGAEWIPALCRLLEDESEEVRSSAFHKLCSRKSELAAIVPKLIRIVERRGMQDSGEQAIWLLGRIGPEAAEAVPVLIEVLTDSECETRFAAGSALGNIGRTARSAARPLKRVLKAMSREPQTPGLTHRKKLLEDALAKVYG